MNEKIVISRTEFKSDDDIRFKAVKLSILEPKKYLTVHVGPKKVIFYYHNRKPGYNDGEETYRYYGGFFKDGRIVKPSTTFMKKYNYCPVSR